MSSFLSTSGTRDGKKGMNRREGENQCWVLMYFHWANSSIPWAAPSRPRPLSFTPPNAASAHEIIPKCEMEGRAEKGQTFVDSDHADLEPAGDAVDLGRVLGEDVASQAGPAVVGLFQDRRLIRKSTVFH